MEFFRVHRDIPFMRHALVFNVISALTFVLAVFFLVTRGLHLSIEFTGGIVMEASYAQAADVEKIRVGVDTLKLGESQVQNFGSSRDVIIRLPVAHGVKQSEVVARVFGEMCKAESGTVRTQQGAGNTGEAAAHPVCQTASGAELVKLQRTEFVGPQVGRELAVDGAKALAFVVVGIMIYLAIRFEWNAGWIILRCRFQNSPSLLTSPSPSNLPKTCFWRCHLWNFFACVTSTSWIKSGCLTR